MGIEEVSALTAVSAWALSMLKAPFEDKAKAQLTLLYDDHLKPMVNNVLGFSKEENMLPVNEDLGKAVIEARNFATQFLFYAYKLRREDINARTHTDFDYFGIDLKGVTAIFADFIFHENHVLSQDHPELDGRVAYAQIHVLLAAFGGSKDETLKFRTEMSSMLKGELLTKLHKRFNREILPDGLEDMLWKGFSVYGSQHEWTEVFVLKFADILKEPAHQKARIAFQNRLLSDIKIDTDLLRGALQAQLDYMGNEFKNISKTLEKFELWLASILKSVSAMQRSLVALHSEIKVISKHIDTLTRHTVSSNKGKSYPHYLNDIPFSGLKFMGRKAELSSLHQLVAKPSPTMMSGSSGVGKTMVLEAYLKSVASSYDHILWISGPGFENEGAKGIFESFKQLLISDQNLILNGLKLKGFKNHSPEIKFKLIVQELRNIKGKNLYIVDNLSRAFKQELNRLDIIPHWDTIIVSRAVFSTDKWLAVQRLEKDDAVEIFSYWHKPEENQLQALFLLLENLQYHPLLIELAAKTISKSFGRLSISSFNELIDNEGIEESRYVHAIEFLDHNAKILWHINQAFGLSKLSIPCQNILLNIYFLKDKRFTQEDISAYLDINDDGYQSFHLQLVELVEQGFLQFDNNYFSMPAIVRTITKLLLKPSLKDINSIAERVFNSRKESSFDE
ncbi:ATP-binding protein [Pedobacter sp. Leaf194]|uniref:ATP-binding protein n=1 Tax=Pedobacter sp. Leaf194 TaxID=1736297 RepID=UPI0007037D71|nr:ATP-binding protein [Pedobacter sp. Leaf194]KQS32456.1 hypothetical protein ASG14_16355 [Pedobacter sp. Leaf194]